MQRKFLFLLTVCLFSLAFLSLNTANASEANDVNDIPNYYLIYFNGEQNEIVVNETTTITLIGWANEEKSSVNGRVDLQQDISVQTIDITLDANEEINQISLTEEFQLRYKLVPSDEFTSTLEQMPGSKPEMSMMAAVLNEEATTLQSKSANTTPSVIYQSKIEGIGWSETAINGDLSGTVNEAKRIEAIQISLDNTSYSGDLSFRTHVQSYGWLDYVSTGQASGIPEENKRIEAIEIMLTGEMAQHFDIYYRVHSQSFGWLDWAKNGESAGTEGLAKRVEALEIVLVKKGEATPSPTEIPFLSNPSVVYSTHVERYGWLDNVMNGEMSGTEGEAKRLEAIKIGLQNAPFNGEVEVSTHVQTYGWLKKVSTGEISGTEGQAKRLEAIKINLTDKMAKYYDIYYRVHAQTFGWLDWAKNGEPAGTEGLAKRLEAIEIVLVEKGKKAPGPTNQAFLTPPEVVYTTHVEKYGWLNSVKNGVLSGTVGKAKRLEAIKISLQDSPFSGDIVYSTHVQTYGWLNSVKNNVLSGTTGEAKRLEAIQISLTGEIAKHYDVYYRVHAQTYGWLGWAKNGMKAGTEGAAKRLEAIEIKLMPKGKGEKVNEKEAFKRPLTVFIDPGHGGYDPGATAGGYKEADLNLTIAKKLQSTLIDRGYKVIMSRTNNTYVSLLDRSVMVNNVGADIFISIHHNNSTSSSANGIESFYYEYDSKYQPKINASMHNNSERIKRSVTLTNLIQNNMVSYTGANNRGADGAAYSVIRETAVPATLLELGFLSNTNERKNLTSNAYQNKLAKAIADGVDAYFKIYY